ncbi:Serine/threonine protein kinase [Handroanthus impetiginosus]|uniref:Serine/threonine protein kinase n=1 Tax=Handroanthus impetiginosus TaxID=429701 RepID=A0A2G9HLW0_9LAMI|nr:Serine/threonine protein kinase [Handroanthus impetiginosus]
MSFGIFCSFLVLTLFFRPLVSQAPNTDESFVSEFLQEMGLKPSKENGFNGSFCSWRGVSCDSKGENVVKLEFSGLGLSGVIPDTTIGKLTKLEYLDLSDNKITSLPRDFYSLGSLKNLNLSLNQISGILPSNIGNFGQLQVLDLSFNGFYGSIPEAISSLPNLTTLNLSKNGFESSIPLGISQCKFLISIDLSGNKLSGSLPSGFGAAFPQLKFLNLAENKILGWDSDLLGMKSIRYLNISDNLFNGSVVGVFEGPLEVLDLSRNQFEDHIPQVNSSSSFSWLNLMYLDISENQFSGEYSTILSRAMNLKHLNLAHNRFAEHEFLQVDMLSSLEYLNLSGTNLTGRIPSNISRLNSLRTLDLSRNHLRDEIPPIFTKNLQPETISENQFSGEYSTILSRAMNLKHLNLAHNRFAEHGFLQVDMLSSLEYLNLSGTNLTGRIPSNVSRLSSLRTLDLSRNHLRDEIPPIFTKNLQVLDLSYNKLAGDIPLLLLQELNVMERFNFSYNNLSYCGSQFSTETLQTAFIRSVNSCPIAANPAFFKRNAPKHRGLKLALVLTLSMICLLVGLLSLAFGCRRKTRMWAAKQNSKGRFGPVYGGLLPGGIHVAVKVLVHGSTMTDQEAARELEYLGRIKHPNLVPLTGYCLAGDQRIAIYEYMENGNLQNLLYDLPLGVQTTEDWSTDTWDDENNGIQNVGSEGLTTWRFRHKIALGTARALAFLHHGCSPPIIHRDVKASSVYLDSNLEPRLSDFGLAKIFGNGLEDEIARGSPGYVPPEFLDQPESTPTPKSDVYGFGVILFELITGKKPVEDDYPDEKEANLVSWVRGLVRRNQGSRAIDPKIRGNGPDTKLVEALKIGYLCTAENPFKRPTMHQVVGLLKDLEPITQN